MFSHAWRWSLTNVLLKLDLNNTTPNIHTPKELGLQECTTAPSLRREILIRIKSNFVFYHLIVMGDALGFLELHFSLYFFELLLFSSLA
jgi:hypothetical protein